MFDLIRGFHELYRAWLTRLVQQPLHGINGLQQVLDLQPKRRLLATRGLLLLPRFHYFVRVEDCLAFSSFCFYLFSIFLLFLFILFISIKKVNVSRMVVASHSLPRGLGSPEGYA